MLKKERHSVKPDRSPVEMTEIVLPSHTNALGTIFGGVVMSWMDIAAAIAAQRYARSPAVTVSVDSLYFLHPIKLGHTVKIKAQVTSVGKTSMEIAVDVWAENSISGDSFKSTEAYFTFVSLDKRGRPQKVPPMIAKTTDERKSQELADIRRKQRLALRAANFR